MSRYEYPVGVGIAFVTCAAFFYAGALSERVTNDKPVPCITNLHSTTHPWFAKAEQEMLENTTPYEEGSDFAESYENPRGFIKAVIEQEHSNPAFALEFGRRTEIITDGTYEYIVPAGCYATDMDAWNGPILWRVPRD